MHSGQMAARIRPTLRLLLALTVALVVAGLGAYVLISAALNDNQIEAYEEAFGANTAAIEDLGRGVPPSVAVRRAGAVLDMLGRTPGTEEALLIGPDRVIRAADHPHRVGRRDEDPKTIAALDEGITSSGKEVDPGENADSFEFVFPVELSGGRYALEIAVSATALENQLGDVRRILALATAGAVLVGVILFYLLGGRSLLRSHRIALERATRDGLTDLPNHRAFQDDVEQAVAAARRNDEALSLAVIDIDEFKLVNDRNGHPEGDAVLLRLAETLREGRSADRPYRIGGDEFAVILANADVRGGRAVASRLLRALDERDLNVSVGVAALPARGSAADLRDEADAALYEAKRRGGRRTVHFADLDDHVPITTTAKREAVRRLIAEEGLKTAFQPIWQLDSGSLLGVEALTRPDPRYGLAGPTEAFEVAGRISHVHELDVLCATRALQSAEGLPEDALLFLNLTPKTLELDLGRDDWLLEAIDAAEMPREQVVVEVTERIEASTDAVVEALSQIRQAGLRIAIDDVGTGNAGLEILRRIGADFVKIDRSIVVAATTEPNACAVLLAMATFARQTGAYVIAEGIEDVETLEFVRGVEAGELPTGPIVQGGQGFELGGPGFELPALRHTPTTGSQESLPGPRQPR